jgi:L,D-peptidoglycan transpeptidase YkuD (ErfK/YbiS/YcfS/YnhG family)
MSTLPPPPLPQLIVRTLAASQAKGWLEFGPFRWPCALGRSGIRAGKREGDGATPQGVFEVRSAFYRPDQMKRPTSALPLRALAPAMGWCDAPPDRNYNREVRLPYGASAEKMWREDRLYDLVIVLGANDRPRVRGRGSAIFMHVARPGYLPTEGCIALRADHLKRLLQHLPRHAAVRCGGGR